MDNKLVSILELLIKRTLITTGELQDRTGLSQRQITYRINKINDLLKSKKVASISFSHGKDIILKAETRDAIFDIIYQYNSEKKYYLTKEERLAYMYLMLFINLDYLSLNHFTDSMKVSRSSVLSNFKQLSQILKKNDVFLDYNRTRGYHITGSEIKIRRIMIKIVINSFSDDHDCNILDIFIDEYKLESFQRSKEIISKLALKHNIVFVEDRLSEFIYIYIFLRTRILSNIKSNFKMPETPDISIIKSVKEYKFTNDLLNCENHFTANTFDLNYISAWILGISVGNVKDKTDDISIISDIVIKIMKRFEFLSGFHYINRQEIFKQLYSHLRPAYYRILFKLPINNPLSDKVKDQYKGLYKLVSETVKPFSDIFGQEMSEDELAYLTIHFGAILLNKKDYICPPKKTALIICSNGIGSSAILYTELRNLFPELNFLTPIALSNLDNIHEPVDIIFTSSYNAEILELDVPLIKVSPVMNLKERCQIKREVYMQLGNTLLRQPNVDEVIHIIKKHAQVSSECILHDELLSYFSRIESVNIKGGESPRLIDVINKNLIQINVNANNWEDAIRKSASALLENNKITAHYVDSMINATKQVGPYIVISKHIALPHARPEEGAKEISIGITTLKKPIKFGNIKNDPVKYVFCLSAIDSKSHLRAIAELLDLLENNNFLNILNKAEASDEIMSFLETYNSKINEEEW